MRLLLYHFNKRLVRLFAHTDINSESEQKCAKTLNEKSVIIEYKRVYRSVFLADLVVELPTTVALELCTVLRCELFNGMVMPRSALRVRIQCSQPSS